MALRLYAGAGLQSVLKRNNLQYGRLGYAVWLLAVHYVLLCRVVNIGCAHGSMLL